MFTLLLTLGCGAGAPPPEPDPPVDSSASDLDAADEPAVYNYEPTEEDLLPIATLMDGIQQLVDLVPSLEADPLLELYEQVLADQGPFCPFWIDSPGGPFWNSFCTAPGGTYYHGFLQTLEDFDGSVFPTGVGPDAVVEGGGLSGAGYIETASGYDFDASGILFSATTTTPGPEGPDQYAWQQHFLSGSFAYNGPHWEDTWIDDGLHPFLTKSVMTDRYVGGREVFLEGGAAGLGGDIDSVVFHQVNLFDALLGSSCELEPSGKISVRAATGAWYEVQFDGPPSYEVETPAELCDGCGRVYYAEQLIGIGCVDFSPLLNITQTTP
jgi:hypothetical protein